MMVLRANSSNKNYKLTWRKSLKKKKMNKMIAKTMFGRKKN